MYHLFKLPEGQRNVHLELLRRGAGDLMGGLAQALSTEDGQVPTWLSVPQLKRALRGAASALDRQALEWLCAKSKRVEKNGLDVRRLEIELRSRRLRPMIRPAKITKIRPSA